MLPPQRARTGLALSICGLLFGLFPVLPAAAQSVVRVGGESALLGTLNGEQAWPSVTADESGGWIVWEDNSVDGPAGGRGIAAARLGADLTVTGSSMRVNSATSGDQEKPQVARLGGGGAFVVWESKAFGNSPAKGGLFGRIFSPSGAAISNEFRISPVTTLVDQKQTVQWTGVFKNKTRTRTYKFKNKIADVREHAGGACIVPLTDGGAVVVYHGVRRSYTNTWALIRDTKYNGLRATTNDWLRPIRQTGDWMQDVYFQRFDANGGKVGAEVRVNQYDPFNQRSPSATLLANGNLLIAWVSERAQGLRPTDNLAVSLYAREMTVAGEPVGDEFALGEDAARATANPFVARVGDGFGVYWSQHEAVGSRNWNVYGRVFEAAGRPVSAPTLINQFTDGDQYAPRVAGTPGTQMVVWTSLRQDGSREGVFGRLLVNGLPSGAELAINTTTSSRQQQPGVAQAGSGRFVVVWSGYAGTSSFDLYSQVFRTESTQP